MHHWALRTNFWNPPAVNGGLLRGVMEWRHVGLGGFISGTCGRVGWSCRLNSWCQRMPKDSWAFWERIWDVYCRNNNHLKWELSVSGREVMLRWVKSTRKRRYTNRYCLLIAVLMDRFCRQFQFDPHDPQKINPCIEVLYNAIEMPTTHL